VSAIGGEVVDGTETVDGAGHRHLSRRADGGRHHVVKAWGPDRATCIVEALGGLVETFAAVPDAAATQALPLEAAPGGADDALVSLFEDVISTVDVFGLVPVRFHLAEAEDGGVAGDMEVVPADRVEIRGALPRAVSYEDVAIGRFDGGWRCRVLVDT
jgi:SHS2 domain-containing protein